MDEAVNLNMISVSTHLANECHTQSGNGTELEAIIQGTADAQWAEMRTNHYNIPPFSTIFWRPTSPTYEAAVSRETYELFGTNNRTTGSIPLPSNDAAPVAKDHLPGGELEDVTQTHEAAQSTEAHSHLATMQIAHACSTTAPCEWGDGNAETCGAQINCTSVSTHFRDSHGIRKMNKDTLVECFWRGCRKVVGRKNFVRHIHECHLGHPR